MNEEIVIHQEELADSPKPKRNWKPWLKRLGIFFGIVVVAVAAFLIINLFKVSVNPFGFGHLRGEDRGRINIMMLGVGDPGHEGETLSDTNIILSIDTRNHQLAIIGIPRDLRVSIPGNGYSKINNANARGGVKLAKRVYEGSFGVPIDYYVKANFTGLKEVVDAVGGVDVDNPDNLYDPSYPCDKNQYRSCGFRLKAGPQHLDGATALKYVRCRKGTCGDDFGRAKRQQQVMESVRQKATSAGTLTNPVAIGKLVSAAGNNIDTDLSVNNLMRFNELTKDVDKTKTYNIVFSLQPDGFLVSSKSSSDLVPADGDFSDIQNFVRNIFKYGPIWSEHPTIMIQNGTATSGVGAKFQQKLDTDGYAITIAAVANALKRDYPASQIIDYTGGKRPHTVSYLQGLLKVQQVTPPATPVKTPPADIVIILGDDYVQASGAGSSSGSSSTTGATR